MDLVIGGIAPCVATILFNPFEVIRTRQQLQGERHLCAVRTSCYTTVAAAGTTIVRDEGIRGLQRGLCVSLAYTFLMNAWRMGIYDVADHRGWINDPQTGRLHAGRCMLWSLFSGTVGLTAAMPLLVIRTLLQAQSIKSDGQRPYVTGRMAFLGEYRLHGLRGFWRGYWSAMPRGCASAVVQLTVFSECKDFFGRWSASESQKRISSSECNEAAQLAEHPTMGVTVASSIVTGLLLSVILTPFDVINTRMFTQELDSSGRGTLYSGVWDCVRRTVRREGLAALYKGFGANLLGVAPHTVLQMLMWEQLKRLRLIADGGLIAD